MHVNGVENFWSLLKRGLYGTYVSVQPFHLFRYLDERVFTYNERKLTDLDGSSWCSVRRPAAADLHGADRQGVARQPRLGALSWGAAHVA